MQHCLLRLKQPSRTKIPDNLENSISDPLKYTIVSHILIVSIGMGKSIRIQRVLDFLRRIIISHYTWWPFLADQIHFTSFYSGSLREPYSSKAHDYGRRTMPDDGHWLIIIIQDNKF